MKFASDQKSNINNRITIFLGRHSDMLFFLSKFIENKFSDWKKCSTHEYIC